MAVALVLAGVAARAGTLTPAEVAQIESALGITLSAQEKADLGAIVKPDSTPAWRAAAEARIQSHRKADLQIQVEDANGNPVPNAQVAVKLRKNSFKFGGVCNVEDLTDATGNLAGAGQSTDYWKRVTTNLFNAVGAGNAFKPKITSQHQYLPGFINWANSNNLSVRGHLLMWPGGGSVSDLTGGTPGVDYGGHLSTASTSAYAHYNVLGAVQTYAASARGPADKAALKTVVDAEIAEWAGRWNVYEWDVINETIGNTLLQEILGYDQMAAWFQIAAANKVNPGAGLLINEFQIISATHTDGGSAYNSRKATYMNRINRVVSDGGPITGIGFQSRFIYGHIAPATVYSRLDDFATAYPNFTLAGTEFEMSNKSGYNYTEYERAQMTEEILTTYFSHDQVTGLNAWNFMSSDAVNPTQMAWYNGSVKLNGLAWYYLHRIRYNTDTNATSGIDGSATINGFKGDYDLTVTYNGNDYPTTITLASNQTAVVTLGDVVLDPGPVPEPVWVPLEQWDYAGLADGSPLSDGLSATGSGLSWPDKAPFGTVSNQMQRWEATGEANESAFANIATNPYANATSGIYQVSYDVAAADFAHTEAFGGKAQFGYGIRDDSQAAIADKNGVVLVRYEDTGGVNKFRLSVSAGTTIQQDIASGSSISNLHVRAVYDLDRAGTPGSFIGYFRIGTGPETAVTNTLASGFVLQSLRQHIQALNGGNLWQPGDTVTIDNIVFAERQLAVTPGSYYAYWSASYPSLGTATNLLDNPDSDALNNLGEYAFGGDPANELDVGYVPFGVTASDGGTNYIDYVYIRRKDNSQRGLSYVLKLNDDLVHGRWTNNTSLYTNIGAADLPGGEFRAITNRVIMDAGKRFIRTDVTFTP